MALSIKPFSMLGLAGLLLLAGCSASPEDDDDDQTVGDDDTTGDDDDTTGDDDDTTGDDDDTTGDDDDTSGDDDDSPGDDDDSPGDDDDSPGDDDDSPGDDDAFPDCSVVRGDEGGVVIGLNRGEEIIPNEQELTRVAYTWDLEISPDGRVVYEAFMGKLFRSSDSGCTFSTVRGLPDLSFSDIYIDPARPARIYLTDINNATLIRSENSGLSWEALKIPGQGVRAFATDPNDAQRLLFISYDNQLHLSRDNGGRWDSRAITFPEGSLSSVNVAAFKPGAPDTALVGSSFDGWYRTTNAGESWEPVNEGIYLEGEGPETQDLVSVHVAYSVADPELVYVMLNHVDVGREIYRSTDGGDHWDLIVTDEVATLTNGTRVYPDPLDPARFYFWFGTYYDNYGTDLYRGEIVEGDAVIDIEHYAYQDLYSMAFHPADASILYLGRVFDAPHAASKAPTLEGR